MTYQPKAFTTDSRDSGFSLLEVLIALVVLSIGLLGVAALQGVGLRSSHGAHLTSQASLVAYDMADRIRANPDGFAVVIPAGLDFEPTCPDPDVPPDPDYTPVNMLAEADIDEWICALERIFPGDAVGRITRNVNGPITTYRITIEWEDLQSGGTPWDFEMEIEI